MQCNVDIFMQSFYEIKQQKTKGLMQYKLT